MKGQGQPASDRSRTTTRKSQGPSKMAEKMDNLLADKPRLNVDQRSDVSSQPDTSTGKAIKKRTAVSPVQSVQEEKRRRASLDVQSSSEGRKKLTKLQKELGGLDLSEVKTKGKHLVVGETKGLLDSEKANLQNIGKDLKDGVAQELKRLATTDGFWSSKPTSRSNSPIIMTDQGEGPLPQKTPVASLRGGRTSTPDISPSSAKSRLSLKQQKKELEGEELAKLNQLLELKRLKTTDGFWSPSTMALGPRTVNSRDGSPSSGSSSLERISKINKPLVQPNEEVGLGTSTKQDIKEEKKSKKSKLVKTDISGHESEKKPDEKDVNQNTNVTLVSTPEAVLPIKRPGRPKKIFPVGDKDTPTEKKLAKEKPLPVSSDQDTETLNPEVEPKVARPRGRPKKKIQIFLPTGVKQRGRPKKRNVNQSEEIKSAAPSITDNCLEVNPDNNLPGEVSGTTVTTSKPKRGRPKSADPTKKQGGSILKFIGAKKRLGLPNKLGKVPFKSKFAKAVKVKKLKGLGLKTSENKEVQQDSLLNPTNVKKRKKVKLKLDVEHETVIDKSSNEEVSQVKKRKRKKKIKDTSSETVNIDQTSSVNIEQTNNACPDPAKNVKTLEEKTEVVNVSTVPLMKAKKGRKKKNVQDTATESFHSNIGDVEMITERVSEDFKKNLADKVEVGNVMEAQPMKAKKGRKKKNLQDTVAKSVHSNLGDVEMVTEGVCNDLKNSLTDKVEIVNIIGTQPMKAKKGRKKKNVQNTAMESVHSNVDNIEMVTEGVCDGLKSSLEDKGEIVNVIGTQPMKAKKGRKKKTVQDTATESVDSKVGVVEMVTVNVSEDLKSNERSLADKVEVVNDMQAQPMKTKKGRKKKTVEATITQPIPSSPGEVVTAIDSPIPDKVNLPPTDIRITPELKRLNTTAGFWAPTPDFVQVLNMPYMRRSLLMKNNADSNILQRNNQQAGFTKPQKPESSLLQHRKKKLNSLKQALNKVRRMSKSSPESEKGASVSSDSNSVVTDHNDMKMTKKVIKRPRKKKAVFPVPSNSFDTEHAKGSEEADGSVINRSKEVLLKETEIMASVSKQIEEAESLIRVDVMELEKAKLLNCRAATSVWNVTDKSPVSKIDEDMEVNSAKLDNNFKMGLSEDTTLPSVDSPITDDKNDKSSFKTPSVELVEEQIVDALHGSEENDKTDIPMNVAQQKEVMTISQGSRDHVISTPGIDTEHPISQGSSDHAILTPKIDIEHSVSQGSSDDVISTPKIDIEHPISQGSSDDVISTPDIEHSVSQGSSDIETFPIQKSQRENIFDVFSHTTTEAKIVSSDSSAQLTKLPQGRIEVSGNGLFDKLTLAEEPDLAPSLAPEQEMKEMNSEKTLPNEKLNDSTGDKLEIDSTSKSHAIIDQSHLEEIQSNTMSVTNEISDNSSDSNLTKDNMLTSETCHVDSSSDTLSVSIKPDDGAVNSSQISSSIIGEDCSVAEREEVANVGTDGNLIRNTSGQVQDEDSVETKEKETLTSDPGLELYRPVGSNAAKLMSKLSRMEHIAMRKKKKSKKLLFIHRKTHTHRPSLSNTTQTISELLPWNSVTETSSPISSSSLELTQTFDSLNVSVDKPTTEIDKAISLSQIEADGLPKSPIRKVRKRKRRNAWKMGVLKKPTYFANKLKKRPYTKQVIPKISSNDTTSKLLVDTDDVLKVSGDVLKVSGDVLKVSGDGPSSTEHVTSVDQTVSISLHEKKIRMLKRLQTNANLANAVLNEEVFKGRFLRRSQPKDESEAEFRKQMDSMTALSVDIPDEPKRKRGRPRKLSCSLPKLTPPDMSGPLSIPLTGKSPPRLSPQVDTISNRSGPPPNLFTFDDYRGSNDGDIAFESVDETDLHLYLSGVSDEDQSPQKDTLCSVNQAFLAPPLECTDTELSKVGVLPSAAEGKSPHIAPKPQPSPSLTKEPRKAGRPKIKGRRGKPPGMPMTEEEKKKKRNKAEAKRAKNDGKLLETISTDHQDSGQFIKLPRTARKSLKSTSPSSSTTFTLRKKSTRSPLEMLEMKRRQEEAIYDLEEERKQARRILLREKRFAKEMCEDYFEEDFDVGELIIKPCSVVLSDFVKKLQLDSIESLSDNSSQEDPDKNSSISPQKVSSFEDNVGDEDWCADLEEPISDEEWSINEMLGDRPYIPRLKLKRVVKKDKAANSGKKSPSASTPTSEKEPIKIVIKTEPLSESSSGSQKSGLDLSKVDRSGFEGSYVDFLKDCQDHNIPKPVSRKKSYISTPVKDTQHSLTGQVGPLDNAPLSESTPKEKAARKTSMISLGEEEDEDILIVDLEEGAQDQNSIDSNKDSDNVAMNEETDRPSQQEVRIQRTISNDEMGLMFASYNNGSDTCDKEIESNDVPADLSTKTCVTLVESAKGPVDVVVNQKTSVMAKDGEEPVTNKQFTEASKESVSVPSTENAVKSFTDQNADKSMLKDTASCSPKAVLDANIKSVSAPSPTHSTLIPPDGWRLKIIHQKDKVSSCQYRCKRCDFTSCVRLAIESHIYTHIPGVQFRCAFCESEFSSVVATVSHLKNCHPVQEAQLYISRHIQESGFYEKYNAVALEECSPSGKSQTASIVAGGQSPPLNILLVVSHPRSSSAPRRYVCTHCGFSTNVKEDAEHHKNDLHPSENLFACLLCKETMFSSEVEIKHHSSSVHPSHARSYRKLPDYYDSEHLSAKGKSPGQEDRDTILEKITTILQVDKTGQDPASVDHKQKAKDYLYWQEEWKEKTTVEADSTTQVEFLEDSLVDTADSNSRIVSSAEEVSDGRNEGENEAVSGDVVKVTADGMKTTKGVAPDLTITSSVVPTSIPQNTQEEAMATLNDNEEQNAIESTGQSLSNEIGKGVASSDDVGEDLAFSNNNLDTSADDSIGLKIVQVVSLSEPSESLMSDPMAKEVLDVFAGGDSQAKDGFDDYIERSSQTKEGFGVSQKVLEDKSVPLEGEDVEDSSKIDAPQDLSVKKPATSRPATLQESSAAPSPVAAPTPPSVQSSAPSSSGGLPLSYKCNACKVHTPYLLMMVKHLKARHPNMRCFACPYCKAIDSFVSQKQLRHHVKNAHPDKIVRNEIALSEEAKKFVEAMVLPNSPECIRVGNRVVLEEDIHTCTYCQLKMTSLAQVYEHLNHKHSDLFEFVCPICQSFKSKSLADISLHCTKGHSSTLDTDKVHVSVPKNLFHVLTCISEGGKYIEKTLPVPEEASKCPSSSASPLKDPSGVHTPLPAHQNPPDVSKDVSKQPAVMTPLLTSIPHLPAGQVPHMVFSQAPLIAIPLLPGTMGPIPTASTPRPIIAFSSALFDTSTLTTPPQLITSNVTKPLTVIPSTAGAASFLSPGGFSLQNKPDLQGNSPSHSVRQQKPKPLPVLNVPSIKARVSQPSSDQLPRNIPPQPASSPARQSPSTHEANNLPESDPSPDAFKIFNLRPTAPIASHSSSPSPSGNMPMVFPPVSSVNAAFIQGPIAGFPSGMVVPQNLVPYALAHQQMLMARQALHASKQGRPAVTHPSPSTSAEASRSKSSAAYFSKSQQPRSASITKEQYELYRQRSLHPQMPAPSIRPPPPMSYKQHVTEMMQQTQDLQTRHPDFQQSLSGSAQKRHPDFQQSQPSSAQTRHPDFQQSLPSSAQTRHPDFHQSLPGSAQTRHPDFQQSLSSSSHSMTPGMPRPSKGLHKRSSSIYQCPYCPQLVPLKVLEVASHIQQYHPGHQVTFKKIAH